jgi:hypothetical protein
MNLNTICHTNPPSQPKRAANQKQILCTRNRTFAVIPRPGGENANDDVTATGRQTRFTSTAFHRRDRAYRVGVYRILTTRIATSKRSSSGHRQSAFVSTSAQRTRIAELRADYVAT